MLQREREREGGGADDVTAIEIMTVINVKGTLASLVLIN
jgi:hypothetical protein